MASALNVMNNDLMNAEEDLARELRVAAVEGNLEAANALFAKGVSPDATDKRGWTALMLAAKYGHLELVSLLLAKGAACDVQNDYRSSALHYAADRGHTSVVAHLLRGGASPNSAGYSPLRYAVAGGHYDSTHVLLEAGADPNAHEGGDSGVLDTAVGVKDKRLVQLLLDYGAEVDDPEDNGWTPLMSAVRWGQLDIAALLIQKRADVNAQTRHDMTPISLAHMAYRDARKRKDQDATAHAQEMLDLLYDAGAKD
jgi:ankyrin repeat protein